MVNRYTNLRALTSSSTSTVISTGNLLDEKTSSPSGPTSTPNRSPTSSIDPKEFSKPSQLSTSTAGATTTTVHDNTQFNSPASFTGLSLQELTSRHRDLAEITLTFQWRETTPPAVAELAKLLPKDPPPAYGPLARGCDAFIKLVATDSCAVSGILYGILHSLKVLIQDAQSQQAPSRRPESSPWQPSKRRRLDDAPSTSQGDAVPKPPSAAIGSGVVDEVPTSVAPDLPDEDLRSLRSQIRELKEGVETRHPAQAVEALEAIKTLAEKVERPDIADAVAKAQGWDGMEKLADALAREFPLAQPQVEVLFKNAHEAAVYEVIRHNPTLIRKDIYGKLSHLGEGTVDQTATAVRAKLAFGLNSETFLQILERVAKSNNERGFAIALARDQELAISIDQFAVLNAALFQYRSEHQGRMPTDRADLKVFASYLPRNATAAPAWAAAVQPLGYCVSREQALIDWTAHNAASAAQISTQQAGAQSRSSRASNSQPPSVEQLVLENPNKGNLGLLRGLFGPTLDNARKIANTARERLAFQLPDSKAILYMLAIVETSTTVRALQRGLREDDVGMNTRAFPDWKIALELYKQTHAGQIPHSEEDIEEFAKCIQPSNTAAAVYWAVNREATRYCEPLDIATRAWRAKDPDKFKNAGDGPLPVAVWPPVA